MRIDCGVCGAEDKVWAAPLIPGKSKLPETMERGCNLVSCRGCGAEGYADLDVTCRNATCRSTNLWRWPNRSMATNTRRWMCRDCGETTECHNVVVMYQTASTFPVVASRGRTTPPCRLCKGATAIRDHDRMIEVWCQTTACATSGAGRQKLPLHRQPKADRKGPSTVNNTNTATFRPNSTTANTHNGETPRVPVRRTFEEKARIKIAKIMERQGCSILVATMLWQQEWEVCDVEEVLSI